MIPHARASIGTVSHRQHIYYQGVGSTRASRAILTCVRFSAGDRVGGIALSPRLSRHQHQALEFWILRLPVLFRQRLPRLKVAIANRLDQVRASRPKGERRAEGQLRKPKPAHAASFIPQRYVILDARLFRHRVELGRILYHEFCHFLWPRLGNSKRRRFADLLANELGRGVAGELGYSSECRKASWTAREPGELRRSREGHRWRDYVCESFCDTGSFVLLGRERQERHSEYTLSRRARARRSREWLRLVLGAPLAAPSGDPFGGSRKDAGGSASRSSSDARLGRVSRGVGRGRRR